MQIAMSDQPPEDLGTIAAVAFVVGVVVLATVGAVLLIAF
jgi:hypothetical protein